MIYLWSQDPREARQRAIFSRLAGADNEIDSEELQDVLTASLTKGGWVSNVSYHGHSLPLSLQT